jgi:hypothetical protein
MRRGYSNSENSRLVVRTMKVDILGTPYEIIVDTSGYLQDNNADGVDKNYSKTILRFNCPCLKLVFFIA